MKSVYKIDVKLKKFYEIDEKCFEIGKRCLMFFSNFAFLASQVQSPTFFRKRPLTKYFMICESFLLIDIFDNKFTSTKR